MHFIFTIVSALHFVFHPVHVSITNVNFTQGLNTADVSFQFFRDDFRAVILANTGKNITIGSNPETDDKDIQAIDEYIFSNFEIRLNNDTAMSFDFRYIKQNEESVWLYYKAKCIPEIIENIKIVNTLMLNIFQDQKNLVILDINGTEKGYTLNINRKNIDLNL